MQLQNEIDGPGAVGIKLTQSPNFGSAPTEVDPQAIIRIAVETFEAVSAVTIGNERYDALGHIILYLNYRALEGLVLRIGYSS
jgi:hypothetical protein